MTYGIKQHTKKNNKIEYLDLELKGTQKTKNSKQAYTTSLKVAT